MSESAVLEHTDTGTREGLPVIDLDTHCGSSSQYFPDYLSARWMKWLGQIGMKSMAQAMQIPRQRAFAHRLDAVPPNGMPGSDPDFAREQLLDGYDMAAAFLNIIGTGAGGNEPEALAVELARAQNEIIRDHWLTSDPRWCGAINVTPEQADAAAAEIHRCAEESDRWKHVILSSRTDYPFGNPKYWPLMQAAVDHDLPLAFHVGVNRMSQLTACGVPHYYFEDHIGFAQQNFSLVPSLIFEGVFDRFPTLKIVLLELGWSWAAPLAWRLDASWRVMRDEVPDLQKKPSEYMSDHFWFTTQPVEEPDHPEWFDAVYGQFEQAGFGDRLMFSSDYPHWDFDSPDDSLPVTLSRELKAKLLYKNASQLYGIPVDEPADLAASTSSARH